MFPDSESVYANPLTSRYASEEMAALWSDRKKFETWRRLWVALADSQMKLGIGIEQSQLDELVANIENIDFEAARRYERKFKHDVMAHIHAYGDVAPTARPIIHLGATSCYVADNTDLILMRSGLEMITSKLLAVIDSIAKFADRWKSVPCLGYTHFQPAQLVTVGKRATLWCYDLVLDFRELVANTKSMPFLGAKGTTGTQASFMALFGNDQSKVEAMDRMVANAFGFTNSIPVFGQTYTRKIDTKIINALVSVAESAHKFGTDVRLLAHENELQEPFESDQIGSSAMAYKRNPMRSERMCSIAKFVMAMQSAVSSTSATQWLERTLDDSAVRRMTIPQSFMAVDAILSLYLNIVPGIEVNEVIIGKNVADKLPFMATENILMAGVKAGGDRQELHERIRKHSMAAASAIKLGMPNDLISRIKSDTAFDRVDISGLMNPSDYIGRSDRQVEDFIRNEIDPITSAGAAIHKVELNV